MNNQFNNLNNQFDNLSNESNNSNNQFDNLSNKSNNLQNNENKETSNSNTNLLDSLNQSTQNNENMKSIYDIQDYSNETEDQQLSLNQNDNTNPKNYYNSDPRFTSRKDETKVKGSTIAFVIIGIIIIITIAIYQVIPLFKINNMVDNTRKSTFVASAKEYISKTKILIEKDIKGIYKPSCVINDTKYISLADVDVAKSSPFGGYYLTGLKYKKGLDTSLNDSYVMAKTGDNDCNYVYYIYLTDGAYKIGNQNNPILESDIDFNSVK